ncbi:hypothetical protein DL96DRAFT_1587697 [Flagelloscypha sp. PMI_526]|nr:hypothetical protein DL96DRAFT_1587697 [Flagelloscypha sp. PMI_526]
MPGSLFPRSPSIDRDTPPPNPTEEDRRVHFASTSSPSNPSPPMSMRAPATPVSIPVQTPRDHAPSPEPSPKRTIVGKGKGRATEDDYRAWELVDQSHVQGMERRLDAAKANHERTYHDTQHADTSVWESERRQDKVRIKALEDEIRSLKAELARRPVSSGFVPPAPPPPPPPPPLPNGNTTSTRTGNTSLFTDARAALKHSGPPKEAPINPPLITGRRPGLPSVGLPPDKVAAFLNEMKTVRLRKVSHGTPLWSSSTSRPAPPSIGSQSFALGEGNAAILRKLQLNASASSSSRTGSHTITDIRIGEKRKRLESDAGLASSSSNLQPGPSKRRHNIPNTANGSFTSTSSSSTTSSTRPPRSLANSSQSERESRSASFNPIPPTPSLCSDNDADKEDDNPPSTPPLIPSAHPPARARPPKSFPPPHEIIDVDMLDDSSLPPPAVSSRHTVVVSSSVMSSRPSTMKPPATPPSSRLPLSDAFSKRPPQSPLPLTTNSPRSRPRPPSARGRRTSQFLSVPHFTDEQHDEEDESDDELSLSFNPSHAYDHSHGPKESTPILSTNSRTRSNRKERATSSSSATSKPRRSGSGRQTLDEEFDDVLRRQSDSYDDHFLESGVFSGTGTRSKNRGFLAHGGAGGPPVFMGEGYVRDVEVGDDGDDGAGRRKRSRSRSRRR